jgi:hypothetical protein
MQVVDVHTGELRFHIDELCCQAVDRFVRRDDFRFHVGGEATSEYSENYLRRAYHSASFSPLSCAQASPTTDA